MKNLISSEEFCCRHRNSRNDFIRNRIFSFQNPVCLLLNMNSKSYRDEPDRCFQVPSCLEFPERTVFKSNLTKARAKLKHGAFIDPNEHPVHNYCDNFQIETWHGYNLAAVDGSTLRVPDKKETAEHFGVRNSAKGEKPCPKAGVSQMFGVLNRITADAVISPVHDGENEPAAFHFLKLQGGGPFCRTGVIPLTGCLNLHCHPMRSSVPGFHIKNGKLSANFTNPGRRNRSQNLNHHHCQEKNVLKRVLTPNR